MQNSLVSVVMGVYNGADLLEETLRSVLAQTLNTFEFIIVDDGSTDPAVQKILSSYAKKDNRIRIITKSNEGLTKSLIIGCAMARGTYIARIDNGDIMLVDRLRMQSEVLRARPEVVCVSCRTEMYGPEWEYLFAIEIADEDKSSYMYLGHADAVPLKGITHHGSAMFRQSAYNAVGGYRREFYYGQDMDLWFRLADHGELFMLPDCLYHARLFPGSISGQNRLQQEEIGRYIREAYWCRHRGESESDALQKAASIRPSQARVTHIVKRGEGAHFIAELLRQQKDKRCRKYFRQALMSSPFRINSWVRYLQSYSM